ncbi:Hypothetical protein NTJ_08395 [Nesidiocoris tenuis]|uniref:Uncharacterized protein n=1 Tax=Nesidiocoris tenuis TaxID=355587 RepID=A0ABN7ATS0_9HEMI|nr:Hypothetical protein NTJ_08395 [Nesidiocoris tenuis]
MGEYQMGYYDFPSTVAAFQNVTAPSNFIIAYSVLFSLPIPVNKKNCGVFTTNKLKTYQVGAACPLYKDEGPVTPIELPELKGFIPKNFCVGPKHAGMLTVNGSIYLWGANEVGQLGNGDESPSRRPTKVAGDTKFSQLVCAEKATLAIAENGEVHQWGQLNPRSDEKYSTPHNCGFKADNIGAGQYHAVATKYIHRKGVGFSRCFTWGLGADGRLGHGNEDDIPCNKAKKLKFDVSDSATSTRSTAVIDESSQLRVFGRNYGNLKVNHGPKILTPTVVEELGEDLETVRADWADDIYLTDNEDDVQVLLGDRITYDDPEADKEGTPSKGSPPKVVEIRMPS